MRLLFLVMTGLYATGLALLLWVARRNRSLYALAKGFCSALFVACSALSFYFGAGSSLLAYGLLGGALLLCAFGDVLLGVANRTRAQVDKRPFLAGALSFTLAHLLFCVYYFWQQPARWYDFLLPLILLLVMRMLELQDRIRLKKMRPVAYLYAFFVGTMANKALTLSLFGPGAPMEKWLVGLGAALFLASDVILLFLYFGTRRHRYLRAANLLSYYLGVYLLALSAWWL